MRLLEKVSKALEVPLDIWIEDEGSGKVIFCLKAGIEIDDSFRLLKNGGWFATMSEPEARARRGPTSEELEELEKLISSVEDVEWDDQPARGSYECKPGESPERIQELIERLEHTVEGRRRRWWSEGRVVWVENMTGELRVVK